MSSFFRERLPFAEAISEPKLLGKAFKMLSLPQQVIVKAFYGLPLAGHELELWSAFQGYGEYDDLGYLTGLTKLVPYVPQEYDTLTGVIGRRSGKSDRVAGIIAAYEITMGGHSRFIRQNEEGKGQDAFWLYIAQDLGTATINMRFVTMALETSPILTKYIVRKNGQIPVEEIPFINGITLRPEPPNIRTGRGVPVIGITMDEFGFWYKDAKSANPDYEVVRALEYSISQFEDAKQVRLSTPWTKEGLLYKAALHGTEGKKLRCEHCTDGLTCEHVNEDREEFAGHLVIEAPTATMGNPLITRKRLIRLKKKDSEAFTRESLAKFTDTQASFLSWSNVERAVDRKLVGRVRNKAADYIAAIDPAFRHDSFVLTIGHHEKHRGVVQDFVKEWDPLTLLGAGQKLNPATVLDEIKLILDEWGISVVYSDQYQLERLQALAGDRDFVIIGHDLTTKSKTKVMNNLASQINQGKIRLLDFPEQESQLKHLQKTNGPAGYVSIAAPLGKKDDVALALALLTTQCLLLPPLETVDVNESTGVAAGKFISEKDLAKLKVRWENRMRDDPGFAQQQESLRTLLELYGD